MKPLGTAHAVLCAKDYVNEPFAMINSDDFYGRDAFIKAYEYLSNTDNDSSKIWYDWLYGSEYFNRKWFC